MRLRVSVRVRVRVRACTLGKMGERRWCAGKDSWGDACSTVVLASCNIGFVQHVAQTIVELTYSPKDNTSLTRTIVRVGLVLE